MAYNALTASQKLNKKWAIIWRKNRHNWRRFETNKPVVPRGQEVDVIEACIKSSYTRDYFPKLSLTTNMRSEGQSSFNEWILSIGSGWIPATGECKKKFPKPFQQTLVNFDTIKFRLICIGTFFLFCRFCEKRKWNCAQINHLKEPIKIVTRSKNKYLKFKLEPFGILITMCDVRTTH